MQRLAQRKSGIEAKNEAETQIYSAEASVREYKDKLPQNVVDNINTEISNVRGSLESGDAEEIRSKVGAKSCCVTFLKRCAWLKSCVQYDSITRGCCFTPSIQHLAIMSPGDPLSGDAAVRAALSVVFRSPLSMLYACMKMKTPGPTVHCCRYKHCSRLS